MAIKNPSTAVTKQNKICEHEQLSSCSFSFTSFQHISEPPLLDTAWE